LRYQAVGCHKTKATLSQVVVFLFYAIKKIKIETSAAQKNAVLYALAMGDLLR
jgi:hypothetical protein